MNKFLKNKLKYKCWHRGTKEMDILLGKFYDENHLNLSYEELLIFEKFVVSLSDDDLYDCITKNTNWPKEIPKKMLEMLEEYSNNIRLENS